DSGYVRPALLTVTPPSNPGALDNRSGNVSNPTPVPTRPARRRPDPNVTATTSSAMPGRIQVGSSSDRPAQSTLATTPVPTPNVSAVFGLRRAGLSHVSLVSGSGSSCCQASFAKRPS